MILCRIVPIEIIHVLMNPLLIFIARVRMLGTGRRASSTSVPGLPATPAEESRCPGAKPVLLPVRPTPPDVRTLRHRRDDGGANYWPTRPEHNLQPAAEDNFGVWRRENHVLTGHVYHSL